MKNLFDNIYGDKINLIELSLDYLNDMYEYSSPHMVRFMKKKYDMSEIAYWDYPWEIEAYGRQLGLFIRWCEAEGIADREDMLEDA